MLLSAWCAIAGALGRCLIMLCPGGACECQAVSRLLGCGCWKCGCWMWWQSRRVCSQRNINRVKSQSAPEGFPLLPPGCWLLYVQAVALAGTSAGCRWLWAGFALEGGVGDRSLPIPCVCLAGAADLPLSSNVLRRWKISSAQPALLGSLPPASFWVLQAMGELGKLLPWEPLCGSCLGMRLGCQLWRNLWMVWMFSHLMTPPKNSLCLWCYSSILFLLHSTSALRVLLRRLFRDTEPTTSLG